MARKKEAIPARQSSGRFAVRVEHVVATELVTIGPSEFGEAHTVRGAFVRVQPPTDATDAQVEIVKRELRKAGAVAIRVLPRPRAAIVPDAVHRVQTGATTIRQVVLELLKEANTKNRDELHTLVEETLAKVKL